MKQVINLPYTIRHGLGNTPKNDFSAIADTLELNASILFEHIHNLTIMAMANHIEPMKAIEVIEVLSSLGDSLIQGISSSREEFIQKL